MVGDKVPIIISIAGHAASMIGIFGPEALGGPGDLTSKSEAEAACLGITYEEFGDRLYRETKGAVVKLPGVPEMFDYEMFPQQLPWKDLRSQVLRDVYKCLKSSNGVILASSHAWEGEAIEVMCSWFSDWGKVAYPLGPLLPSNFGSSVLEDSREEETKHFLDSMLARFGENSTILISLGSVYWPTDTEYLDEIINALIEKNFPFILSHASPFAKISQDLGEKIKSSGHGMLTLWCPQQMVLNHSATGWLLTHCGHSSVTEALASGVPMIAWPFEADQPATASQLESLNLAIELLEVRSSEHALKPLWRNGRGAKGTCQAVGVEIRNVIDACREAQGKELRKNAMAMKEKLNTAWKGSGPARMSFNDFVNTYVSQ
ncbi:UDP-Glycosyltransferase/glycogen phosphorylase [Agrocybe pediades]|nr:UDP-Glycosyltransferase/glycogen phosphorylase [Agrocybe pediades]